MGKELPLAREEEEGQPMLLAVTGSGELITTSSIGNERTQKGTTFKTSSRRETEDTETKSTGSSKAKGVNASTSKSQGRRRDNKDRKSNRGNEGEDRITGRSAQELEITFPGSYCDKLEIVPHYWIGIDKVYGGSLFQCKFCHSHLWLPLDNLSAITLGKLVQRFGKDEGYCHYLNRHRAAKVLMAKLQDLRRLEAEATNKREFARLADKILNDKEYDRKE